MAKLYILPRTKAGNIAVLLMFFWPVLIIIGALLANGIYFGVEAGNSLIEDFSKRPLLGISMLSAMFFGITSFSMSLIALIRNGERSLLSLFALLISSILVLLLIGELLFEH